MLEEDFKDACDGHAAGLNAIYSACIDPAAATGGAFKVGVAVTITSGKYNEQSGVVHSFSSSGKSAKVTITAGADKSSTPTGFLSLNNLAAAGSFGCQDLTVKDQGDVILTGRFLNAPVRSKDGKPGCEAMVATLKDAVSASILSWSERP